MKEVKVLTESLYPTIEKNLKIKSNSDNLFKAIGKYYDRNNDILYDSGIAHRLLFLEKDKNVIYDSIGLDKSEISRAIKASPYIKSRWKIMTEPLNTAMVLAVRYYTINKKDNEAITLLIYYACYFYASKYSRYFPYEANENIMEYTIANLSNKYLIKQKGSLFKCFAHTVSVSHEKYKKELLRGEDGDLALYVSALKTRINDFLKNIKNEYTKNHDAKKFINYDSDNLDPDDFHIADNASYAIKRVSESSVITLLTYGPDNKICKLSANLNQVSENEIRNVIFNLSDKEEKNIMKLTELILQLFLVEENNSVDQVGTNTFFIKCMEIYKKSNTNDKIILEIKAILDRWLNMYSANYKKSNREATLSNFRRAVFTYFVLHIERCAQ